MASPGIRILDPTVAPTVERGRLSPRIDSLDGKVIGLYNNGKLNASRLMEMVGEELREQYAVKDFVTGKFNAGRVQKREEWPGIDECDTVILGIGD
jgi:hypothetical protein